jgi:hypothetical protein
VVVVAVALDFLGVGLTGDNGSGPAAVPEDDDLSPWIRLRVYRDVLAVDIHPADCLPAGPTGAVLHSSTLPSGCLPVVDPFAGPRECRASTGTVRLGEGPQPPVVRGCTVPVPATGGVIHSGYYE